MKKIIEYPGYCVTIDGKVFSEKSNKYLKPSFDKQGYARVGIYIGNYKTKTIKIHRLVAQAFIDNPFKKTDVNHINGIKNDNRIENLEWSTRSENMKHAFKNGLKFISENQRNRFIKMSKSQTNGNNPASRKIVNIQTGEIFDTIKEVLPLVNLKRTTFQAMLSNQNPNKTNYKYYEQSERKSK
jgi:hypothetical protein